MHLAKLNKISCLHFIIFQLKYRMSQNIQEQEFLQILQVGHVSKYFGREKVFAYVIIHA